MRRDVRGRVVLVTGASRGIGREIADRLADRGAKLVLAARHPELLDEARAAAEAKGCEVLAVAGDLTDPAHRQQLRDAVAARFGTLDVLINNAGMASFGEFATSTESLMRTILEINFFTPLELIRLFTPMLRQSADAHAAARDGFRPAIVNCSSICGKVAIPSFPEHSASKFALTGFTEALRAEYSRFGIDVLMSVPGIVHIPDRQRHYLRNEGRIALNFETAQPPAKVADGIVSQLEMNRRAKTVGALASFLILSKRLAPRILEWFIVRKVRNFERRARAQERRSAATPTHE